MLYLMFGFRLFFRCSVVTSLLVIVWSFSTLSFASGIVIKGTRVIYPASQSEVTIGMTNTGTAPVLVQSWIDNGNQSDDPAKIVSPFVLTPPISRVDAGKGQILRIVASDNKGMVQDKESVFYLNVLEIPTINKKAVGGNKLNIAFRSRLKLFYRPEGLSGTASEAADKIKWTVTHLGVKATNPSSFYVSMGTVTYSVGGKKYTADGEMIAPGSSYEYVFNGAGAVTDIHAVSFNSINDYGTSVEHRVVHQ